MSSGPEQLCGPPASSERLPGEADSSPRTQPTAPSQRDANAGQEPASRGERTCREPLRGPTPSLFLHPSRPAQRMGAPSNSGSSCCCLGPVPRGATHSRSTESSSLPAPLLSARPRGQWGVACPRGPPYPRARLRQRPKAGVWDVGAANPSRRPPVRPFPGHQEVEALQGQGPRGHRERVSGLWSCNREGRRLKAEWRAGLGSG